jgi:hypothetical protein
MELTIRITPETPQSWLRSVTTMLHQLQYTAAERPLMDEHIYKDDTYSHQPNPETLAAMLDVREGRTERFDSVSALMDDLHHPVMPEVAASTVLAAAPPPPGLVVDSAGLPWDGRIHAESKAFVKDGTWRQRRNTPEDLVAQVEAELRAALAAPASTDEEPELPLVTAPPPPVPVVAAIVPPPPSSVPVVTDSAVVDAAPVSDPMAAFAGILTRVTTDQAAGTLSAERVHTAAQSIGLGSIRDLMVRADLVPAFERALYGA